MIFVRGDLRDQVQWKKEILAKLKAESDGNSAIGVAGKNEELFKLYKPKSEEGQKQAAEREIEAVWLMFLINPL